MTVDDLQSKYDQLVGQRKSAIDNLKNAQLSIRQLERQSRDIADAVIVVQHVAKKTQQLLEYRVSELVSFALQAVFDDPYEFKIEFVTRNNKTECNLEFLRNGKIATTYGGGVRDVASFALRIAIWTMRRPRTRAMFVLDEPFRHLKGTAANRRALTMVKSVSERLNLQVLMISDERVKIEDIERGADRLFRCSKHKRNDNYTEAILTAQ